MSICTASLQIKVVQQERGFDIFFSSHMSGGAERVATKKRKEENKEKRIRSGETLTRDLTRISGCVSNSFCTVVEIATRD